ncbi:MAG: NUDIX hydrolase [bacterium]|nr:NUDIX hydrolase [bacterium]
MKQRTIRCQAVVMYQDRILLIKHLNHHSGQVYWWLPGGGVEANESPEEAVVREVKEETHLDVTVHTLLSKKTDEARKHDYHTYMTYLCHPQTDAARPGSECESSLVHSILDVAWYPLWDEFTWEPEFAEPHLYPVLKTLQGQLRPSQEDSGT